MKTATSQTERDTQTSQLGNAGTLNETQASQTVTPSLEARILSKIQTRFPLTKRPYASLAKDFGCTEKEALACVNNLRKSGVIRRIGATFDPSHLGYTSTLAAISVPEDAIETAATIVNEYSEVTHNYLRNDAHNIWFTVIAPSRQRIETVLTEITKRVGCTPALDLPATRLFKIRVNFDIAGLGDADFRQRTLAPATVVPPTFSAADIQLIVATQASINNTLEPFDALADACGTQQSEVIETLKTWHEAGVVRRFGAVVRHRKMGISANAMTVWNVSDNQALAAGVIMAGFPQVSHCYERPRRETWPDNLYTMIHASTPAECEQVAAEIKRALAESGINVAAPRLLFSIREFKKRSMRYFAEETRCSKNEG